MTSGGIVTNTFINAALVTASAAGATYFRIGSVGLTSGGTTSPVKYMKQNNRWAYERNVFKKPSSTAPKFTLGSEEHTSELQSLMRISYAVLCLKKKNMK